MKNGDKYINRETRHVVHGVDIHGDYHEFIPTKRQFEILIKMCRGGKLVKHIRVNNYLESFSLNGYGINVTPIRALVNEYVFSERYHKNCTELILCTWVKKWFDDLSVHA